LSVDVEDSQLPPQDTDYRRRVFYNLKLKNGEEVTITSYINLPLEAGGEYVVLIDNAFVAGEKTIHTSGIAKINPDSTITAIVDKDKEVEDSLNYFTEFNGKTVQEMEGLAKRVIAFYERY